MAQKQAKKRMIAAAAVRQGFQHRVNALALQLILLVDAEPLANGEAHTRQGLLRVAATREQDALESFRKGYAGSHESLRARRHLVVLAAQDHLAGIFPGSHTPHS